MDARELLSDSLSRTFALVRGIVDGLTDDEFFWEPVPGCWSVRPNTGADVYEVASAAVNTRPWYSEYGWDGKAFAPERLTTIGWLVVHLCAHDGALVNHAFGDGSLHIDDIVPSTAADAVACLADVHEQLTRALPGCDLDAPHRTDDGPQVPGWEIFRSRIMHETHHGGEIARMRDLYRSRP